MSDTEAARPTGTVTFLFTDIEGSTSRWEEQTEEPGAALARHDDVLRTAVEAVVDHLRTVLGASRFDRCVATGAAMELGDAFRYAHEQIQLARKELVGAPRR